MNKRKIAYYDKLALMMLMAFDGITLSYAEAALVVYLYRHKGLGMADRVLHYDDEQSMWLISKLTPQNSSTRARRRKIGDALAKCHYFERIDKFNLCPCYFIPTAQGISHFHRKLLPVLQKHGMPYVDQYETVNGLRHPRG